MAVVATHIWQFGKVAKNWKQDALQKKKAKTNKYNNNNKPKKGKIYGYMLDQGMLNLKTSQFRSYKWPHDGAICTKN